VHKKIEEQSKAEQKDAWDQFKAELEDYFLEKWVHGSFPCRARPCRVAIQRIEPGNFRKNTLQSPTKRVKMPWIVLKTINNGEIITSNKLRLRLYSFSTVGT
jgi:hypothetical protein